MGSDKNRQCFIPAARPKRLRHFFLIDLGAMQSVALLACALMLSLRIAQGGCSLLTRRKELRVIMTKRALASCSPWLAAFGLVFACWGVADVEAKGPRTAQTTTLRTLERPARPDRVPSARRLRGT